MNKQDEACYIRIQIGLLSQRADLIVSARRRDTLVARLERLHIEYAILMASSIIRPDLKGFAARRADRFQPTA